MLHSQKYATWPRKSLFFIMLASLMLALSACSDNKESTTQSAPIQVSAAPVLTKSIHQWDAFNGRITATESVDSRARVSGYIEHIAFQDGAQVKAGELLFSIDPRPYQAILDNAKAQLERAQAAAQLARIQHLRAQKLIAANAISHEEFDMRRAASVQTSAEAQVKSASLNLGFTQIRSPIDGHISRAILTVGNLVQADQSILSTVVSKSSVYIYLMVYS